MSVPTVSVLIPTFNRTRFLPECIRSILAQTLSPSQVLVINDGSIDSTREVLRGFGPAVQVVDSPQLGKSGALNVGLRLVSGEYTWIFDDDDVALPDALERFVAPLHANRGYCFSYSHYWYTPNVDGDRLGTPVAVSHIPDVRARGFLLPLLEANFLGGAALFARTSCYAKVGDFDPSLVRSQDYDMAIRIARQFRGIQVHGGPTFHYRQHSGRRGSSSDRFGHELRNKKWLEYDQLIFLRLYRDLPLEEFLIPGLDLRRHRRTALLQRAAIMASKGLIQEVLADLTKIAERSDQSPLSVEEIHIVQHGLALPSWYGAGIRSDPRSLQALKSLARRSPVLAEVRSHVRTLVWGELAAATRALVRNVGAVNPGHLKRTLATVTSLVVQVARLSV